MKSNSRKACTWEFLIQKAHKNFSQILMCYTIAHETDLYFMCTPVYRMPETQCRTHRAKTYEKWGVFKLAIFPYSMSKTMTEYCL